MDTFEKKLCEGMAALVLLAVLGFYFAVYAGAYYHETINRAIDAQFGLTGTIALHLPLTYKAPASLVGYSISTTSENVTRLAALEASDPAAYSQWWAEIVATNRCLCRIVNPCRSCMAIWPISLFSLHHSRKRVRF